VARHGDGGREPKAGKKLYVLAGIDNFFCSLRAVRPDRDGAAVARQRKRQRGSPCSRAEHHDLRSHGQDGHAVLAAPNRCSLPASRRRMLGWCFTMMSRATMTCAAMNKAGRGPLTRNHAKM